MGMDITSLSSGEELAAEDGLLVIAKGLGLELLLANILLLHADSRNLCILLNTSQQEFTSIKDLLETIDSNLPINCINNETPAKRRQVVYHLGGVMCVTSRILIVDMLNNVLPTKMVSGIMVNHAHKVKGNNL
jgi:DNA excision repair protein ERCC-4